MPVRADADGGNVKELSRGKFDLVPVCSADSKTVLYADADSKLEKVAIEGGASQQFADYGNFARIAASRGRRRRSWGCCRWISAHQSGCWISSGPALSTRCRVGDGPIVFKRDGSGVIYPVRDGQTDNLWLQHLAGSPGKQLTDFKSEFIRDFDYSYDGKQLAIIRGHREADVELIRDSEK